MILLVKKFSPPLEYDLINITAEINVEDMSQSGKDLTQSCMQDSACTSVLQVADGDQTAIIYSPFIYPMKSQGILSFPCSFDLLVVI